jgi:tetratricopeptide (TPR) repeat protein
MPHANEPCPCGSGHKYKRCCYKKMSFQESDHIMKNRALAFKEMSQENWLEAVSLFKSILDEVSDKTTVLEAIAACHDGMDDYLRASEYYEKAIATAPEKRLFDLYYRLGVSRGCAERIEKSVDAFLKALELQHDPMAKKHLEAILQLLGEIQEGKRGSNNFFIQIQIQRAFTDMDGEKYDDAAARLEQLCRLDPDNPVIFYNLGVAYAFLKREQEALDNFQRTIDIYPDYVEAWYNMGQILMITLKDFSRAYHCFSRAVAIRPGYVGAQHQKGIASELLGDKEGAIASWTKTLELDPGNKQAIENITRLGGQSPEQPASAKN